MSYQKGDRVRMGTVQQSCLVLQRDYVQTVEIVSRFNPKYEQDLWLVQFPSGARTVADGSMLQAVAP